jgi:hypothetical protein
LELYSGTGGSFIQKKKRILDSKKRKSRLFLKKRIPSQCEFLASQFPNQIWNVKNNDSICKVRGLFFEQRSRPLKARALFQEFATSAHIFGSGNDLLHHVRALGEMSPIHGYFIKSYQFQTSKVTSSFWKLQLSIIAQLRLIRSLSVVVAIVISNHDRQSIAALIEGLTAAHWKIKSMDISYPDIGNSIADSCSIITTIHTSCASMVVPIKLKTPPCMLAQPIGTFLWEPFDRPEHSLCLGWVDAKFNKDDGCKMMVTVPCPADASISRGIKILYHLHCKNQDCLILAGASVLSPGSLCLPFESSPNQNLFQKYFGIKFHHEDSIYVRAISAYEFACCFKLSEQIQY